MADRFDHAFANLLSVERTKRSRRAIYMQHSRGNFNNTGESVARLKLTTEASKRGVAISSLFITSICGESFVLRHRSIVNTRRFGCARRPNARFLINVRAPPCRATIYHIYNGEKFDKNEKQAWHESDEAARNEFSTTGFRIEIISPMV